VEGNVVPATAKANDLD